jgi:hypothetical protein
MASSATLTSPRSAASSSAMPAATSNFTTLDAIAAVPTSSPHRAPRFQPLLPIRNYLDALPVEDEGFARLLYKVIPGQCPFERDVVLFGRTVAHIPPLCKLNPFYEQVVGLRFRAMCYLVDECGVAL